MQLFRSPIIRAGLIFSLLFGVAFAIWPPQAVNDALDAFVIAGAALTLWRFGAEAWHGMRQENPDGPSVLIVAIFGLVASVGAIRILRELGLELGLIGSRGVGVAFGIITAVMVFSIFLLVIAPPVHNGRVRLSPWWALGLALASGMLLTVLLLTTRHHWWLSFFPAS